MEKFGIQVLRFTNKGILSNLYGVCEYIDLVVKNRLKKLQDSWKAQQRGIFLQTHIEDSTFHQPPAKTGLSIVLKSKIS